MLTISIKQTLTTVFLITTSIRFIKAQRKRFPSSPLAKQKDSDGQTPVRISQPIALGHSRKGFGLVLRHHYNRQQLVAFASKNN
nr:hypothetical protein [Vibrio taketomensis]